MAITENLDAFIGALEDDNYKWRTVKGIAKDLSRPEDEVIEVIDQLINDGRVIRSSIPDEHGEALYTTRRHYREKTSVAKRILSAFTNRLES